MQIDNKYYIRIGQLRKEKRKTIADVSIDIGVSASAISNYERGLRSPDASTLIKLARYFDCTTDYLLGLSDSKSAEESAKLDDALSALRKPILQMPQNEQDMLFSCLRKFFESYEQAKKLNLLQDKIFPSVIRPVGLQSEYILNICQAIDNAKTSPLDEEDQRKLLYKIRDIQGFCSISVNDLAELSLYECSEHYEFMRYLYFTIRTPSLEDE